MVWSAWVFGLLNTSLSSQQAPRIVPWKNSFIIFSLLLLNYSLLTLWSMGLHHGKHLGTVKAYPSFSALHTTIMLNTSISILGITHWAWGWIWTPVVCHCSWWDMNLPVAKKIPIWVPARKKAVQKFYVLYKLFTECWSDMDHICRIRMCMLVASGSSLIKSPGTSVGPGTLPPRSKREQ